MSNKNNITQNDINELIGKYGNITITKENNIYNSQNNNTDNNTDNNLQSENNKNKMIKLFNDNVKNKKIIYDDNINNNHHGKEGHWLEKNMGLKFNNDNSPDIFGYEMKKNSNKISYGDWSATEYLFNTNKPLIDKFNKNIISITRSDFIKYFGTANPDKNNRYSWSGKCFPKFGKINDCGQIIYFSKNNDLCILYYYSSDKRDNKKDLPDMIKKNKLLIAVWTMEKLKKSVENKFNKEGYFICKKNINGVYDKICFGPKIDFNFFVDKMKSGEIILDSGMYDGNTRNYSNFRSNNKLWLDNIIDEY